MNGIGFLLIVVIGFLLARLIEEVIIALIEDLGLGVKKEEPESAIVSFIARATTLSLITEKQEEGLISLLAVLKDQAEEEK